jgi:hypothetical protein
MPSEAGPKTVGDLLRIGLFPELLFPHILDDYVENVVYMAAIDSAIQGIQSVDELIGLVKKYLQVLSLSFHILQHCNTFLNLCL